MPTQQEINLTAYKSGKTPEAVQTMIKNTSTVIPIAIKPQPVPGNTMDTSTGAPYVKPIVTTTDVRNEAKSNADYIDSKTSQKTVVSTTTSGGKTTKTYSDGTTEIVDSGVTPTSGTANQTDILNSQQNIFNEQTKFQADISSRYDSLKSDSDNNYNALVENIKNEFAGYKTKMADANKRFEARTRQNQYLTNGFRYTPQTSEGMVYDAEQAGLARLSDLALQESTAIQKALQAKNDDDYQALAQYTNTIRNIQSDRLSTLEKMSNQMKVIEETDKNIRNMNENEASIMQSMIDSYILTSGTMGAKESADYYDKKAKELTDVLGFTVAPEFVKAQIEGAKAQAEITVSKDLSDKNGYYTDTLGRPMLDSQGKTIVKPKDNWYEEKIGNTLNVGTYDKYGNKVMETYDLEGTPEKTWTETVKEMASTPFNKTVVDLMQLYKGDYSYLLNQNNVRIPTTVKAFKNLQGGGMQCAEYVNRIIGTSFGSSMSDKLAKASDKTGQVGSVAVWDAGNKEYGHLGIILGDNGDTWTIRSSNIHGDTMVSTDVVPKSAIKGYYTPDSVKNLPEDAGGKYNPINDKNLTQVGNSTKNGLFYDKSTGQTITGDDAMDLYGSKGTTTGIGDDPALRSIAIGQIAYGKNVSDTEGKKIMDIITKYPNASNQDIALLVKNMNINNPANKEKALQYLNVFQNMKTPPQGYEAQIANLLNRGDIAGLDAYLEANIERAVQQDVPADEFISSSSYQIGKENTNRLISLIENNKDEVGIFDGNINKWKSKFVDTPVYNEIETLLQMTQADRRKYFAGSAVTEQEMKALENFIGGKGTMTPEKLITMLQTLQNKTDRQYNAQRALYRKPDVNATYSQAPVTTETTDIDYVDFSNI